MIVPIGAWVVQAACQQLAEFQSVDPLLTMSVNLSVRQLEADEVIEHVHSALERTGVDPGSLTLELTETLLLSEAPQVPERLHALKALGVKLAIDDFGTGFSSLGYLQRLPVDVIKIDRSFVEGLKGLDSQTALVKTIVKLSEMLGLQTVAEGVETAGQLQALKTMACRLAQGYLFAKPLEVAAALAYARTTAATRFPAPAPPIPSPVH